MVSLEFDHFQLLSKFLPYKLLNVLGPVHMIPGQLSDTGVNFASVHSLTPVIVHMSFSLLLPEAGYLLHNREITK